MAADLTVDGKVDRASDRTRLIRRIVSEFPSATGRSVLVGVDGPDGSGKTTFAAELAAEVVAQGRPAVVVHADHFLNLSVVRYRRGRLSPEGFWLDSYDYDAMQRDVLEPLGPRGDGRYRPAAIDPYRDTRVHPEAVQAEPGTVAVVEGLFLHRDRLRSHWAYSIFLDVPFVVTADRMAARDGTPADPDHPGLARYVEGQRRYFRACSPWLHATRVIDNTEPAAARVVSHEEAARRPSR